jgi:hypothetical protein
VIDYLSVCLSYLNLQLDMTSPLTLTEDETRTLRLAKLAVETHSSGKTQKLLLAMLEFAPSVSGKLATAAQILQSRSVRKDEPGVEVWELDQLSDHYWSCIILPGKCDFRSTAG